MSHMLIVGGTGMLKDTVLYYTKHSFSVSVIARSQSKFDRLISSKSENGFINPVKVDYNDSVLLKEKIRSAIDSLGKIDICIAWIHSASEDALSVISKELNEQNIKVKFYHILGSESANPLKQNIDIEKNFARYPNIIYKKIILGFVIEESHSRWLTDQEISNGVIDAVEKDEDNYIVGAVEPWKSKP